MRTIRGLLIVLVLTVCLSACNTFHRESHAERTPEDEIRACLVAVIDDVERLKPKMPELASFDALKLETHIGPRPGFGWRMGFSYRHDVRNAHSKSEPGQFGVHGCSLGMYFGKMDEITQVVPRAKFPGLGVNAYWYCGVPEESPSDLAERFEQIIKKRMRELEAKAGKRKNADAR